MTGIAGDKWPFDNFSPMEAIPAVRRLFDRLDSAKAE
jgi:hypothetical protein